MKAVCTALVLSTACLWPVAGTAANPGSGEARWSDYRNERFGFRLQYPADLLSVEKSTESGDARLFSTRGEQARLLVGALRNADKHSIASYEQYILRNSYPAYTVTYQRQGESWFVASGHDDKNTFYEKVMFTCGGRLISSFAMIYPNDQRAKFDPIVEHVENSFRPAAACEPRTHSAAQRSAPGIAPKNARKHANALPRPAAVRAKATAAARIRGPRSDLADRIARDRGRDVIVILRRNGPPYDRKILRGYVSR